MGLGTLIFAGCIPICRPNTITWALIDIEKEFDSVEWPFLWETPPENGLPPALYQVVADVIQVTGGRCSPWWEVVALVCVVSRYAAGLPSLPVLLRHRHGTGGGGSLRLPAH